jgi:hypothetical protein
MAADHGDLPAAVQHFCAANVSRPARRKIRAYGPALIRR